MTRITLVTGGAGYVGSHAVLALRAAGHAVVVLDNLSTGHAEALPPDVPLVVADLADRAAVGRVFREHRIDAVLHFAALSLVGQSMRTPLVYLRDNYVNALNLLDAMVAHGVSKLVLSSTANLFGAPERQPIAEDAAIDPGSAYGESKYLIERALVWAERVHGLRFACLRYFNAAGADPEGRTGEDHEPETHLIPLVLASAAGRRPELQIYGDDYPTPDGTCIRDYVHVMDLADAHVRVLGELDRRSCHYNVGTGCGYSVREVIAAVQRVTGRPVPARVAPRRAGDPPVLVADPGRIITELGWEPRWRDLDAIVASAWAWHAANPDGFSGRVALRA